ncbi:MAG: hypothetical protein WC777_01415 [Candidatus Gracilibacteria bacterium]
MDNIRLSWDLFILVFFAVIIAYSFIIGRDQTLKVIISTYMAILTADGVGNLLQTYLLPAAPSLQGEAGDQALVLIKIFTFVLAIVLLAIKGGFIVDLPPERSVVTKILGNLSFGFLNAGLMVSTLLVYLTGGSFVMGSVRAGFESNLYQESQFIQSIVDNYNIWFSLPVLAIVVVSLFHPSQE